MSKGFASRKARGKCLSDVDWKVTGRSHRSIDAAPTEVAVEEVVEGHSPPCCIDQLTPTPVGKPSTITRPARWAPRLKSHSSSPSSTPLNTEKVSARSLATSAFRNCSFEE